jgi:biotin synthase
VAFNLETSADILDLLSWANRIREQFKGNKIHLCSIVNAKAGACSENCSFCAQSSHYQTGSPKYGFVDPEPVAEAAEEANKIPSPPSASSPRGKAERRPDAR